MQLQKRYRKAIDKFVRRAKEEYGDKIERIVLFGSVARGEAQEESDIDLLVIWKGEEEKGWEAMSGLAFDVLLDTKEYISVKVYIPSDLEKKTPFKENVMKEGITLV